VGFAFGRRLTIDRELEELGIDPAKDGFNDRIADLESRNAHLAECRKALEESYQALEKRFNSTAQELVSCKDELQAQLDKAKRLEQLHEASLPRAIQAEPEERRQEVGGLQKLLLGKHEDRVAPLEARCTRLELELRECSLALEQRNDTISKLLAQNDEAERKNGRLQECNRELQSEIAAIETKFSGFALLQQEEATLTSGVDADCVALRNRFMEHAEAAQALSTEDKPPALRDSIHSSRVLDQSELSDSSLHTNSQHGSELDASSDAQETPRRSMRIREKRARPAEIPSQRQGTRRVAQPRGRPNKHAETGAPRSQVRKGANA
jgi:uncharacterized protein YukE